MISFAIIVFREMLEIALVLSVLLIATRGVAGRGRWIWGGLAAGLAGSAIVAFSTEQISDALEGFGQEVFNASVLLAAALLIGITVIWMKRHAREISQNLKNVGSAVSAGKRPMSALAVVVALTILRDGSEVVLLAHGLLAASQSALTLAIGGALGFLAGGLVGLALYFGLIKSASRYIFAVTTWLLVALCAGMVSQAVNLLSSADILPTIIYPIWDTTAAISDGSTVGQTLHILAGYTARPSAMQLLCYVATVLIIAFALRRGTNSQQKVSPTSSGSARSDSSSMSLGSKTLAAASLLTISANFALSPSPAQAIDKIYSPIVEGGELDLETRGTYDFDDDSDKDDAYKQLFGLGYGLTDRFAAEGYVEIEQNPDQALKFEALIAETRYQLFEQGEYWLDWGTYSVYQNSFPKK